MLPAPRPTRPATVGCGLKYGSGVRRFTTPPSAPLPCSTEPGPLTTSARSSRPRSRNEATAPCGCAEFTRTPSTSTTTLSFFSPRSTGFWPQAPSDCTARPGSPRNISPAGAAAEARSGDRTSTACGVSIGSAARPVAVTTTASSFGCACVDGASRAVVPPTTARIRDRKARSWKVREFAARQIPHRGSVVPCNSKQKRE